MRESVNPPERSPERIETASEASNPALPQRSWWEVSALFGVVLVAAFLRLWHLSQNELCNLYFTAGVRSMLTSWHNFLYNSFDPGGFISINKPPVALWIQALSAKLMGFGSLGVLLPQALAGVAVVVIIYSMVRRVFGPGAGLLAALAQAVTPICVVMDRHNNPDGLLVFFQVLACWAILRATEKGRLALLLCSVTLAGVAFNVKMLAAFVVLPTFYLLYFLGAPQPWAKRFLHLTAATVVLSVVSLSWTLLFDLTPADQRPFAADTKDGKMMTLTIGFNGLDRLTGGGTRARMGAMAARRQTDNTRPRNGARGSGSGTRGATAEGDPGFRPGGGRGFGPGGGPGGGPGPGGAMFGVGNPGLSRFANKGLAAQIIWLFPLAVVGALIVALQSKLRLPLGPEHQSLLLWGGWALTFFAVFSFARAISHSYYTNQMGPPLAALTGIGIAGLWKTFRRGSWFGWLLPAALLATAYWQAYLLSSYTDWGRHLTPALWGGVCAAIAGLIVSSFLKKRVASWGRWSAGALAVGLAAVFASPTGWSATAFLAKASAVQPAAGPEAIRGGRGRGPFDFNRGASDTAALVAYLRAHRDGEKFLVATANTQIAAPIVIETGEPVMAMGGWLGTDPAISLEQLKQMIAEKKLRYVLLSSGGFGGGNDEKSRWIRDNCDPVPKRRWQKQPPPRPEQDASAFFEDANGPFGMMRGMGGPGGLGALYDCRGS